MDDQVRMDLRGTKIGKMARNRNLRVLLTSIIVLIIGIMFLEPAISSQNYGSIIISLIVVGGACYGIYLFIIRSMDLYNHPDIKQFLSFMDSDAIISLMEKDISEWPINGFIDTGFISDNFIIFQSTYRFRWIYNKEIIWIYPQNTQVRYKGVIPIGTIRSVVVCLRNGEVRNIQLSDTNFTIKGHVGPIDRKEILSTILSTAPFAYFGYDEGMLNAWKHDRQELISDVNEKMRSLNYTIPMKIENEK